jgi:hypothetical protein
MTEEVKELSMIEQATQTAERIEKANAELKQLLDREERINAEKILAGRSNAGTTAPVINPEEKAKQDLKNYFKGTIIEKMIK